MSLINQMLKDLEKRRADSVTAPDSPLKGVNRYAVARRRTPYLLYSMIALLVVLAALVGYLGWAYWQNQGGQGETAAVQDTAPVAVNKPANPAATREAPPAAPAEPEQVARPDKSTSSTPAPAEETAVAEPAPARQQTASAPAPAPESDAAPERQQSASELSDESVSKRSRPLSDAQRAELAYKEGYRLLARGQQAEGERKLRQALEQHAQHQRARELLAGVYMKYGRFVEAAALLKEGVNLSPENSLYAKMYARVLLKQNQPVEAIRVLERQPPPPAVDSEYHALLAAVYQQGGQYLKSAGSYRDVLRIDPEQGKWWLGLGVSLEKLGKYEEARAAYMRARQTRNLSNSLGQYVEERLAALDAAGL